MVLGLCFFIKKTLRKIYINFVDQIQTPANIEFNYLKSRNRDVLYVKLSSYVFRMEYKKGKDFNVHAFETVWKRIKVLNYGA